MLQKKDNEPIAWSGVLPTSKSNAEKFLKEEINEKQLFEESGSAPSFESLYLFAVVVLPEYRQKGLAKELLNYQVEYFVCKHNIKNFYAWVFSQEGEKLIKSLEKSKSININYINKN